MKTNILYRLLLNTIKANNLRLYNIANLDLTESERMRLDTLKVGMDELWDSLDFCVSGNDFEELAEGVISLEVEIKYFHDKIMEQKEMWGEWV